MDLQELTRRIVLGHWVLIAICVFLCAGSVTTYHLFDTPTYSASTRLVLDAPAPTSGTEATAVADAAKAIATSPTHVIAALNTAGVQRDPVKVIPDITLVPLGTSGVLQLTVKDTDAAAAASIANALAADLIQTRLAVSPAAHKATLDAQIKTVTDQIAALNADITTLKDQLKNLAVDPANPQTTAVKAQILADRITFDDNEISTLTQQLIHLDSERSSLGSASDTTPSVIDTATVPVKADPSRLPIDLALALVIGSVLGVGISAAKETFKPTLASGDAVSKALDAPILGWLPDEAGTLPIRLKMAATASEVRAVELIGIGDGTDLTALARSLRGPLSQGQGEGKGVAIFAIDDAPARYRNGQAPPSGFVLVTPERISKTALAPVQELITISGRPLLGLIASKPERPSRTSIPGVKRSPQLSVVLDGEKDVLKGMSKEMQSDLWGAR